jgi:CRISPR-associated protein Cst2
MNLFATVLTYPAPSANYRGESDLNRTIIQKVTEDRFEYPIISPEAMRNAMREILRAYGLPCNRERLHNEEQLAVKFADYPWPEKYVDDFLFGYLVAKREQIPEEVVKKRNLQYKRDSILRMNLAKALEPYRHDAVFTQSPLQVKNPESPWQNADTSALLHRETSVTAFQYPLAINLKDCKLDDKERGKQYKEWLRCLLKAISELNDVAGNHARSYFEMAPSSIVLRLTDFLVAGYNTYGFKKDGSFPELVEGVLQGDYPGQEFYFGGLLVRQVLSEDIQKQLNGKGAHLYRMANQALDAVAQGVCGQGFLTEKKETA